MVPPRRKGGDGLTCLRLIINSDSRAAAGDLRDGRRGRGAPAALGGEPGARARDHALAAAARLGLVERGVGRFDQTGKVGPYSALSAMPTQTPISTPSSPKR